MSDATSRVIRVPGAEIHTVAVGDGPVALVLHGGLGIDHLPYRSLDPLGEHLRLVYVDHRGNGRSTGDPTTATMQEWAADAAAVAGEMARGEPVLVIGHSYGGFIAQEMAIAHGGAVSGVILVTTTPGQLGEGEHPAPEGPPMPAEFAEMLATMPESDDEYAAFMDDLAPAYLHRTDPAVLRDLMADTRFSAAAMRRGFEELAHWSSVDRLGEIGVPVLVAAGRHDPVTAWPQAERIAGKIADAEVVIFENSSHFAWLDEPDSFFGSVTAWLTRRGFL